MNDTAVNAITKFQKVGNHTIAYRSFGQGDYLLVYNRFKGILDTWDPLFLDSLAKHNTVIVFDYPGIGDSDGELPTDTIEVASVGIALMDALEVETFNVAGWSYGGQVAQAALFKNKERVQKAVLIGTNPPGTNLVPFEKAFFERALKPSNDEEDEIVVFFEPDSEKSRSAAKESFKRIAQRLDRSKIPAKPETFQRYFAGAGMLKEDVNDFRGQYKTLTNPVLVISADHDISFAVENWFPLLRNAPSMQHIIINDSGHGLQHQQPVLLANYINQFLQAPFA